MKKNILVILVCCIAMMFIKDSFAEVRYVNIEVRNGGGFKGKLKISGNPESVCDEFNKSRGSSYIYDIDTLKLGYKDVIKCKLKIAEAEAQDNYCTVEMTLSYLNGISDPTLGEQGGALKCKLPVISKDSLMVNAYQPK